MTDQSAKSYLADVGVLPKVPAVYERDAKDPRSEAMPSDLVGATINAIGAISGETNVGGGGLIIDYMSGLDGSPRRVVFGFSELGMWIEFHSP
jgi:hypothetical protein